MGVWYIHDSGPRALRDYGVVPFPKGPTGDHVVEPRAQWYGAIPVKVENPRAVIEVVRALFQLSAPYIQDMDQWSDDFLFVNPGIGHLMPDRNSVEIYSWMLENMEMIQPPEITYAMEARSFNYGGFLRAVVDGASAAGLLAEERPAIQAELNQILGQ